MAYGRLVPTFTFQDFWEILPPADPRISLNS
jgi:hypothetical protein